jgi:hypothetical protein
MDLQAHFSDIRAVIAGELDAAAESIVAAVAWLTDPVLLEALVKAARRGCRVQLALIDDAINRPSGAKLEQLQAAGGAVFWIPEAERGAGSLHHKFCVIDGDAVITGSYNWTRRAGRADENILVAHGDLTLAQGYLDAFDRLLEKYALRPAAPALDTRQIMQRLEVLRNLLLLEDFETVATQWPRLEAARGLAPIAAVLERLRAGAWEAALEQIQAVLARGLALVAWQDPALAELRLELLTLEAQIVALSSEQADLERQIEAFARQQYQAIGEVMAECLHLRREYWRLRAERSRAEVDQTAQAEAEADQVEFERDREAFDQAPRPATLDADQQQELKRLYREAAMRCHPDRVTEADQAAAQTIFLQVQRAYQQGDLDTLNRLHRHLTEGRPFPDPAQVWTEQEQMRGRISRLQLEIERRLAEIRALRASETYQTLAVQSDWAGYFATVRQRLEQECAELRQNIAEMGNGG